MPPHITASPAAEVVVPSPTTESPPSALIEPNNPEHQKCPACGSPHRQVTQEGNVLIKEIEQYIGGYVSLDEGLPFVLSLWAIATYSFESFDVVPYLAVTSPTKRCGKTRLAEVLEFIAHNPKRTVGISPAALYRTIEQDKPTLLIDEGEGLSARTEKAEALREILNAGYRKGQEVTRCGGSDKGLKPETFRTYCPKAMFLIGTGLPDTLVDRCISISLRRQPRDGRRRRFRYQTAKAESADLRHQLADGWFREHEAQVAGWYGSNDLPFLSDREEELWLPLFAICAVADPERVPELTEIAVRLAGAKEDAESADASIKLLSDVRGLFSRNGHDRFPTQELLTELVKMGESPWSRWSRGRELDARGLSRLLRPYGIQPQTIRQGEATPKGYYRQDFEDAWKRYLPEPNG